MIMQDDIHSDPLEPVHDKSINQRQTSTSLRSYCQKRFRQFLQAFQTQLLFFGAGLLSAIAYIDPGNWATDLGAGASYGNTHLFVILLSGIFAIFLQILASRLGIVSNKDLAQHCRSALYDRPKHRWLVLYPLYALYESAIIFTDLAELLGSAIAINLLIPKVPLWAGVLLTSADIFIVLLFFPTYGGKTATAGMRIFELTIGVLLLVVLACFCVLLQRTEPDWSNVFRNYLPSAGLARPGAFYAAAGIIGATVMPHSIVLGSRVACVGRYQQHPGESQAALVTAKSPELPLSTPNELKEPYLEVVPNEAANSGPGSLRYVQAHLKHAGIDIVFVLTCFALVINSAILIVSSAAFYKDPDPDVQSGDLFAAHRLIGQRVGKAPAFLFALGLLLAGQAASLTVTLAGQVVSEGFLHWTIRPWLRRLITRLIGMVPSLIVAVASGRSGLDTLLVASQVALSFILPFIIIPLLIFTSNPNIMNVAEVTGQEQSSSPSKTRRASTNRMQSTARTIWKSRPQRAGFFANSYAMIVAGALILAVVLVCNVYSIVELGLGQA